MAVKHKVEIIQVEHVTRNNVREKLLQRRSAASYLQYRERRGIGKILELITVKFAIPEKKILISAEPRAVTQCRSTIFGLVVLHDSCAALDSSNIQRPSQFRHHWHALEETAKGVYSINQRNRRSRVQKIK